MCGLLIFISLSLSSISGHRVFNYSRTHFYSATKFAITSITEGLRQELREMKSAIKVTVSMHIQDSLWTVHNIVNLIYYCREYLQV